MVTTPQAYTVRREFTAAGRVLPRGTRLVDPQWPNTKALIEVGYLAPVSEPEAVTAVTQDTQSAQPKTVKAKKSKRGA